MQELKDRLNLVKSHIEQLKIELCLYELKLANLKTIELNLFCE